jgi:hypothetical protein
MRRSASARSSTTVGDRIEIAQDRPMTSRGRRSAATSSRGAPDVPKARPHAPCRDARGGLRPAARRRRRRRARRRQGADRRRAHLRLRDDRLQNAQPRHAGPAGATLAVSRGHVELSTQLGGLGGDAGALPLSGVVDRPTFDAAAPAPFHLQQIVPVSTSFTTLRLKGRTTSAMTLIGSTVEISATLVRNDGDTALSCATAPALTGLVAIGTEFEAACTGNVPFAAGDLGYVRVKAAVVAGLDVATTFGANVTAGLA